MHRAETVDRYSMDVRNAMYALFPGDKDVKSDVRAGRPLGERLKIVEDQCGTPTERLIALVGLLPGKSEMEINAITLRMTRAALAATTRQIAAAETQKRPDLEPEGARHAMQKAVLLVKLLQPTRYLTHVAP
jgi:hypothetical protein